MTVLASPCKGQRPISRQPNVILVILDCGRPDHLFCYGYHRETTPHIDKLAREGAIFERCISPAPWTLPSMASMFTGLYASQHGVSIRHQFIDEEFVTLAELLTDCGYQTAGFNIGSWIGAAFGFARGFASYREVYRPFAWLNKLIPRETIFDKLDRHLRRRYDKGARAINRAITQWFAKIRDPRKPFFLYVHYAEPHLPYRVSEPFYSLHLPPGVSTHEAQVVNQDAFKYMARRVKMDERDFLVLRSLYDGALSYQDYRVAELVNWLRELDLLDETVLIITSDHGENLGEHELMDHQYCLYDTLLRVPLIIRYPPAFRPGTRAQCLPQNVDLFPTILDLLGIRRSDVNSNLRGASLLSTDISARTFAVSEYLSPMLLPFERRFPFFDRSIYNRELRSICTGDFKYIWSSDGKHELYNLQDDPQELWNLIERRPDLAARMQAQLDQWLSSLETVRQPDFVPEIDKEVLDRLRGLGYL